jgi:hypothetical protein
MTVSRFKAKEIDAPPRIIISQETVDFIGEVDLDLAMQLLFSAQLRILQTAVEKAPDDLKDKLKGYFYDVYNLEASGVLALFAPEIEMRPDLTAEAILAAENQILDQVKAEKAEKAEKPSGEAEMASRQLEIAVVEAVESEPFG